MQICAKQANLYQIQMSNSESIQQGSHIAFWGFYYELYDGILVIGPVNSDLNISLFLLSENFPKIRNRLWILFHHGLFSVIFFLRSLVLWVSKWDYGWHKTGMKKARPSVSCRRVIPGRHCGISGPAYLEHQRRACLSDSPSFFSHGKKLSLQRTSKKNRCLLCFKTPFLFVSFKNLKGASITLLKSRLFFLLVTSIFCW